MNIKLNPPPLPTTEKIKEHLSAQLAGRVQTESQYAKATSKETEEQRNEADQKSVSLLTSY